MLITAVVFVRALTASLSGLIGIFGLSLIAYSVTEEAVLLLASVLWGLFGHGLLCRPVRRSHAARLRARRRRPLVVYGGLSLLRNTLPVALRGNSFRTTIWRGAL